MMNIFTRLSIAGSLITLGILTTFWTIKYIRKHGISYLGDVEIVIGIFLFSLLEIELGFIYLIDGNAMLYLYKQPIFLVPLLSVGIFFGTGILLNFERKHHKL